MQMLIDNVESLISPDKNLMSAFCPNLGSVLSTITPPHPTELPMPSKLLFKGKWERWLLLALYPLRKQSVLFCIKIQFKLKIHYNVRSGFQ